MYMRTLRKTLVLRVWVVLYIKKFITESRTLTEAADIIEYACIKKVAKHKGLQIFLNSSGMQSTQIYNLLQLLKGQMALSVGRLHELRRTVRECLSHRVHI